MSRIVIGQSDGKNVHLDLDVLLRTRLLVQANSGGGKSWAIRRIVEQAFGKIQIIIIDPEGEFATLREKYGFVLAGKGGDTPADVRSAELLAQRLLELRASCVCDIFEMKPFDRHRWVKLFLDSMLNAPKKLWHPALVVVDEAHKYAPEKGAGESEASESMVGLCTTGRKRGFCAVFATQRLGKLRKDASAELLNRLVGPTFEDVDRKRASDLLGILKSDEKEFFHQIQMLEPGNFFALGRAITTERLLVKIGPVVTTHPEVGAKYSDVPPPPPDKVIELLPQLADLPKQAEDRARNVQEMQSEIRSLKQQLRMRPLEQKVIEKPRIVEKIVKVPEIPKPVLRLLDKLKRLLSDLSIMSEDLSGAIAGTASLPVSAPSPVHPYIERQYIERLKSPSLILEAMNRKPPREVSASSNGDLSGPEQRILDAIAWMNSIGITEPLQTAVAFLAGYTVGGGAFNNPRGRLRTNGLIEYRGSSLVLTEAGLAKAHAPSMPLDTAELQSRVLNQLPNPEQKILRVLLDRYPNPVENDELAREAGYEPGGGAFNNPRGRLRTLGLVGYPEKGMVRAADLLFVD